MSRVSLAARCAAAVAMLALAVESAHAVNDNFADAISIVTLPFADDQVTSTATTEPTDPPSICFVGAANSPGKGSVWYRYRTGPVTEYVTISTQGSSYDSIVNVYTGGPDQFHQVLGGCNDDGVGTTQSRIAGLRLAPDTDYAFEVTSHGSTTFGGALHLSVTVAPRYLVTRTDDPSPALATCLPTDCTLRAAVRASNLSPGAILLPAGTYAISLGSSGDDANNGGDFDVLNGVGIYGAGMHLTVVDAAHKDRAFDIDPDSFSTPATGKVTAILADLSVINGGGPSFFGDGGGVRAYGSGLSALVLNDFVALDRVSLQNNRSQLNGGAMALGARGMLRDCEIDNNFANSTGGGLTLGPPTFGGDTTIEIVGSTISNNQAPSTISGGGGIKSGARLRIVNSTIVANTTGYHGGGIYATGSGSLHVRSSTIARNTAAASGAAANGGGIRSDAGTVLLANAILADNARGTGASTADDCTAAAGTLFADHSVLESTSGCAFVGNNNVTGVDPGLSNALADHGGPTRTLMLTPTSIARDAGDPLGCFGYLGDVLVIDQRGSGYPRVSGARCDAGAVEGDNDDALFQNGFDP